MARLARQAPDVDGVSYVSKVNIDAKAGDFVSVTITGGKGYDLDASTL